MFESIQNMIHRVRTIFGDSDLTYGGNVLGEWENFAQGILQSNCSGPIVWAILSPVIFECLHSGSYSNFFFSALSKLLFVLVGFSYVDDTNFSKLAHHI